MPFQPARSGLLIAVSGCLCLAGPHKAAGRKADTPFTVPGLAQLNLDPFEIRLELKERAFDPGDPAQGDFQDCAAGICQSVLLSRIEPDEQVALPRNKARESLRFLTFKGYRSQGRDRIVTAALFRAGSGDSLFVDVDNDENLGNDRSYFWPFKDSCVAVAPPGAAPFSLCRAGAKAHAWQERCETLKAGVTWADCGDGPYRFQVRDIAFGSLAGGRKLGLVDSDGDGVYRPQSDRFLVDWNGDGVLEKSLDKDGFPLPDKDPPFDFSVSKVTYRLLEADPAGAFLRIKRLDRYNPASELFKPLEGKPAPNLRFVNMDGDTVSLSDFRGKKVLVNFWSSLCLPCLEQFAQVRQFWTNYSSKNWQVVSLTTEADLASVQQVVLKYKLDWMVGMVGPEARCYYTSRALPINVKIAPDGTLEKRDLPLGNRPF